MPPHQKVGPSFTANADKNTQRLYLFWTFSLEINLGARRKVKKWIWSNFGRWRALLWLWKLWPIAIKATFIVHGRKKRFIWYVIQETDRAYFVLFLPTKAEKSHEQTWNWEVPHLFVASVNRILIISYKILKKRGKVFVEQYTTDDVSSRNFGLTHFSILMEQILL